MNRASWKITLGCAALLAVAVRGTTPSTPPAGPATLQQRIDALLKHRLKPEPLPANPPNPFQMIGTAKRDTAPDESTSRIAASSEPAPLIAVPAGPASENQKEPNDNGGLSSEALITCATRLKLGGVIILKDQIQIVVNGVPRREGDTVAAEWNNTIIYLKIARLLPGQLVLRYGEAEATVRF